MHTLPLAHCLVPAQPDKKVGGCPSTCSNYLFFCMYPWICVYMTVYVSRVLGHTVHIHTHTHTQAVLSLQGQLGVQHVWQRTPEFVNHYCSLLSAPPWMRHFCFISAIFLKSLSSQFVFDNVFLFLCLAFVTKHILPVTTVIFMVSLALSSFRVWSIVL